MNTIMNTMTTPTTPVLVDATMLLRWKHLAPVGIVRLERLIAGHLRRSGAFDDVRFVVWDHGYRYSDEQETDDLDQLLNGNLRAQGDHGTLTTAVATPASAPAGRRPFVTRVRRTGLRTLGRVPDHLRPFAEQAMWSVATLGVESVRHVKRRRAEHRSTATPVSSGSIRHRIDLDDTVDLVALGLGWEYLDHEAMYRLKVEHGVRIHMPAFDLIPVLMPQMNAGQSHLVHRFYAEMAHYADTITSISFATRDALADFYRDESLPTPHLAVNQLPGLDPPTTDAPTTGGHRLAGDRFVLSVSTIEIRKNHLLLAKLWAECIREGRDMPKLVIVGRYGWDIGELQRWAANAPELEGRFVMCPDVDDDELMALYRDAEFTVFPSRVEGWGLPITESLAYGKACIHSDDPAQFEASQNLMPALHPDDFLGWKREILRLLDHPDDRIELEQRIATEYVAKSAGEYCAEFEAILRGRRQETPA